MVMIFEDNESMVISKMLKNVYGDKVLFTGGNKNLINLDTCNDGESIYIFVDLVCDNNDSIMIYSALMTQYINDDNVHIIPIPCIEFYMLLTLYNFNLVKDEDVINLLFILGKNESSKRYSEDSFELYCKSVLNKHISKCFHNTTYGKNRVSWCLCNCECNLVVDNKFYCKFNGSIDVEEKTAIFLSKLPMFICNKYIKDVFTKYGLLWTLFNYDKYIILYKNMISRMILINSLEDLL